MNAHQLLIGGLILGLILLSGIGDSQFFLHASTMWSHGKVVTPEIIKSAIGGVIGIAAYWATVKFLEDFGIVSPEIQTILWFSITIIGVALVSGKFHHWQVIDQVVAFIVILGIGWLLVRTGSS